MTDRHRRRLAAIVVALSVLAPMCCSAPAMAGTYCRDQSRSFSGRAFAGVNDIALVAGTARYRACTFGRLAASGVGWFRYPLAWSTVEPHPGQFNFSTYDALMAVMVTHHVRLLPILMQPPTWAAVRAKPESRSDQRAPASPAQYAQFVSAVVERYGPHGTFWTQYPQLPRVPIRAWQIWNEPNLPAYWAPSPSPAAYTRFLKAADVAIKRLDRSATVITAGMPYFGPLLSAPAFYRAMMRDGAGRWFDAFALHDYAQTPAGVLSRAETVRSLMNAAGARRKALWITEFGWASSGPASPYTVRNATVQARYLSRTLSLLTGARRRLGLGAVMLWSWRDQPVSRFNFWGLHCGLYTLGLKAKPSLAVFTRWASRVSR